MIGVVPVLMTTFIGRMRIEDFLAQKPTGGVKEIEELLPLFVAKEISLQMPDECIKAQSVIARTNLMSARELGEEDPEHFTTEELQTLWGSEYKACLEKLEKMIKETEGETLQYQNQYINAAYHQTSAGNTRNMSEYSDKNIMPYLSSAACHEDTTADGYLTIFFWTEEEFLSMIKQCFEGAELSDCTEVAVSKRDSVGYVLDVTIGQTMVEGEQFRKALKLPSACFEIAFPEGGVRIVTLGQGHGFGLSQSMACHLANEGYHYQEILSYFYKDVTIKE